MRYRARSCSRRCFLAGRYYHNHKYDSFAKCLAAKQAKNVWPVLVSALRRAKGNVWRRFHYVPYVECAMKGNPDELAPECKAAGVKLFPSWQFGSNAPTEGVLLAR